MTIDDWSFARIDFIRRATGMSHASIVRSVLERLDAASDPGIRSAPVAASTAGKEPKMPSDPIKVFAEYKGHHVDGTFDLGSLTLRVTTGPLSGRTFESPTAAAVAVVKNFTPERVNPETNGRKFWRLCDGTGDLRSILGQRV
ncbi:hypothetical protein [Modestobacter sp. VKM Ac-2984]|uniref:hypothetical protein n=1 Tax=Modestobacter sp. VKM Ac-2984 TaxID=3004138 RepID=UPI0022AA7DD2|nr:hypothetical protein [Modestobacter sp. VKM Ac-2984]MCZ2817922.1 hypothetical protein [Modestobacter sp. VKM Ac-2984]